YGNTWVTESGARGGTVRTFERNSIPFTKNDFLYNRERFGMSGYDIPAVPGYTYRVVLRLSELYWTAPGQRVFDIKTEGVTRVQNLDIFKRAGGRNRAYYLQFDFPV